MAPEQIKSHEDLAQALREAVTDPEYRCLVAVAFYPDGAKLVIHGVPNLELEAGMLQQAIQTLAYRKAQVDQAIMASEIREKRSGVN
jgi:hypothetical protein